MSSQQHCAICGMPLPDVDTKYSKRAIAFEGEGINGPVRGLIFVTLTDPIGGHMCDACTDLVLEENYLSLAGMAPEEREALRKVIHEQ